MKRRSFLKGAAVAAATGSAGAFPAPAIAQQTFHWKMVTTWPKNFPGLGTGAQRLADSITEASEGRLTVKLYAAGELVPAFEVFDAVRDGHAECGHDAPVYWVSKNKSTPFFGTVPGGLTAQEHNGWIYSGGGQELWDELYGEYGLRAWPAGNTGCQMGGWFQNEINSLDDFKGLKMRIPGLGGEVVNRLGGTSVNMPGGEIMPALQSGVINAAEWVGPWNDLAFGFYKVTKYYYGPGFHEPCACLSMIVNLEAYEALPKDLQRIVRDCAAAENTRMLADFTAANGSALQTLIEKHGVQLRHFPDDVFRETMRHGLDVVAETAAEGEINRRIYESWAKFRKEAMGIAPTSDYGYMQARALYKES
ncbi:MAG: ABC transporter substrate-binding protein [Rhodospirillaceae bacterium]|nr:ABC transporter substrate-binding protein [Rhodospirillaceae bacterium]